MSYSLKQAAEAVGRGKPAILRAIQKGIISAQRSSKNEWLIDPAELHRVYPPVASNNALNVQIERYAIQDATEALHRENALLREQIELLKDERQDLRRRLDEEATERRKLSALLTHQPDPKPEASHPAPDQQWKGKLWEKIFGRTKIVE
jgi:hypothetical protein